MFAFGMVACLVASTVNRILIPKCYYDDIWPTTSTYQGFYQMEKDSVDVLFLGSSCAAAGLNPQEFYDSYGIRSYNLGCEGQSLLTSYYWLEEALRFQSPKVVVLEVFFTFLYNRDEPLNTAESSTRKAFDYMRWSPVTWEAVHDICNYDKKQTLGSYYFPNIRYHTRWKELEENDFISGEMAEHYELKGYAPLAQRRGNDGYVPLSPADSSDRVGMAPLMREYLDRIVMLCRENGISLILTKMPDTDCNVSKYNTMSDYAQEQGIPYWDFNEESLYRASGFVHMEDMNDDWHVNLWGAEKISRCIAEKLYDAYGITGIQDGQWEDTKIYYDMVCRDCELKQITDIEQYMDAVSREDYTVLIAVKGDGMTFMEESVKEHFRQMGIFMDYSENEWLSDIRSEGERMSALVNQLVVLARMDEDKTNLEMQSFSLSDMIMDVISEFQMLAQERGKSLEAQIDSRVDYVGDETAVRRVVSILLDNAVKYCDDGGRIRLRLEKKKHPALYVENTYADVGETEIDKMFDRFYRADKARTFTGGFGVGLSIAKAIVTQRRGEINAYKKDTGHIGFKVIWR